MSVSRAVSASDITMLRKVLSEKNAVAKENAVNKKIPGSQEYSPLHVAVKDENFEMVQELLKNKANPNTIDSRGDTPLHVAAKYSTPEINAELIKYGANVSAKNTYKQIPLHVIGQNANKADVASIAVAHINKGANIEALDIGGKMPKDNEVLNNALDTIYGNNLQESIAGNSISENGNIKALDTVLEHHFEIDLEVFSKAQNPKDYDPNYKKGRTLNRNSNKVEKKKPKNKQKR